MERRKEKALQAAVDDVPAREASAQTGMALFGVGIWGTARLRDVSLSPHVVLRVAGSALAFSVEPWQRKWRNVDAYEAELGRLGGRAGP